MLELLISDIAVNAADLSSSPIFLAVQGPQGGAICEVCRKRKIVTKRAICNACQKFAQRHKGKVLQCKKRNCNGANGSLNYCPACRYREILKLQQKSPDLVKGHTDNFESRLQSPMTSLRMPTSSALLPSSLSQVTTPCTQFPTISHNQLQTSSVDAFVNYQGLPHANHQPHQRIHYQNHAGIQQQNNGNCSGVFDSREPDLYGLNQKSSMNPSQANYLQNDFGMTGSYNYLHNYHWMNQNAHSSLQPGSTIGNMENSQFPTAQNSTKKNLPTPHSQPHNLNGNVDQLSFANNGYNGMTMAHQWNPSIPSMQNYFMLGSPNAQVQQQISQMQECKSQHYIGHQSLPQNFVTNTTPAHSSTSQGSIPTATQSIHAGCSAPSSSGYGALNSSYMINIGTNNLNNFASEVTKDELNLYLGPGHSDLQTGTI
ncbi:hypothetical protein DdX_12069 [Ditylenchus destructor]|uniref:Uncharacterized protein n=1 Tax=Ditylenchus destructor TaxID=166010 RepID=A0AAD4MVV8_9BILA|nr:hypothetical protein DdX_12069 [Ditylenchus destructor]